MIPLREYSLSTVESPNPNPPHLSRAGSRCYGKTIWCWGVVVGGWHRAGAQDSLAHVVLGPGIPAGPHDDSIDMSTWPHLPLADYTSFQELRLTTRPLQLPYLTGLSEWNHRTRRLFQSCSRTNTQGMKKKAALSTKLMNTSFHVHGGRLMHILQFPRVP